MSVTSDGDTLAAIATPPGNGGIAIIRLSGQLVLPILLKLSKLKKSQVTSHRAYYRKLYSGQEVVDTVIFLPMLEGRSYTGEDVLEIHCHGGYLLTQKILELVLHLGARAAQPGEFTLRAFLNGKIDLLQAEAVQEVIGAKNQLALAASEAHLQGRLSEKIKAMQKQLADLVAILEAWVDFPEEGLEYMSQEEMEASFKVLIDDIRQLLNTYREGRILKEGLSLCLVGCPNVGKSSLMNALLKSSRAIVTPIPGTTRDLIEEEMMLKHLNVKLIDTAGIRETKDIVEKEGVKRSLAKIQEADVILWVLDQSKGFQEEDHEILSKIIPQKTVVIWNKNDQAKEKAQAIQALPFYSVSALCEEGLEALKEGILKRVLGHHNLLDEGHLVLTQSRHYQALKEAKTYLCKSLQALQQALSPELIALEGREALKYLGGIIGMNISEEILASIFSKFCIGK